jgi:hypothetical protein
MPRDLQLKYHLFKEQITFLLNPKTQVKQKTTFSFEKYSNFILPAKAGSVINKIEEQQ